MGENSGSAFAKLLDGFGPVQRVVLFIGFVILGISITQGFSWHNAMMMIGIAVLSAGFAGHYWASSRWDEIYVDGEKTGGEWKPGTVFLAIVFSAICVMASWQAYRVSN